MQKIKGIYGQEPMREGEYPDGYTVGYPNSADKIVRIEYREQNYSDHGIGWYDAFAEHGLIGSMNARFVAVVHYFPEEENAA